MIEPCVCAACLPRAGRHARGTHHFCLQDWNGVTRCCGCGLSEKHGCDVSQIRERVDQLAVWKVKR